MTASLPIQHIRTTEQTLRRLQTALSYPSYHSTIFSVYLELIRQLSDPHPEADIGTLLQNFFELFYPDNQYGQTLTYTAGSQFLSGLSTVNKALQPHTANPTANHLQPRHRESLLAIGIINKTLSHELTPSFASTNSTLSVGYVRDNVLNLAVEIDRSEFIARWNRFIASVPRSGNPTPGFAAALDALHDFLSDYLTIDGNYTQTSPQRFAELKTQTESQLMTMTDGQRFYLCSLLANATANREASVATHHLPVLKLITGETAQHDDITVNPTFELPEKIDSAQTLEHLIGNNQHLGNNLAFFTALFNSCQHYPDLQRQLVGTLLEQHQSLRAQFNINEQRLLFKQEISIDYWLHDALIACCRLSFDGQATEAITDLTRFILTVDQQPLTGIEKIYAVVDRMVNNGILDTPAAPAFTASLHLVPGLDECDDFSTRDVQQAANDFRQSVAYHYLISTYEAAIYDLDQLRHFATHCADPDISKRCDELADTWNQLSDPEKVAVHDSVLQQYFANAPFAMAHEHYPQGVPTDKLFSFSKLTTWYAGLMNQQTFQATEEQHFYKPAAKSPTSATLAASAEHRAAYRQFQQHESLANDIQESIQGIYSI